MKHKDRCSDTGIRVRLVALALSAAVASTAGHAQPGNESAGPVDRSLGPDVQAARIETGHTRIDPAMPAPGPSEPLTLRQALDLALAGSPELAAQAHGVLAAEGEARQAAVRPNPELEIEAEEFGGPGDREGYAAAETTLRLSQTIELGGKRTLRGRVARAAARLARWDYEAARLDVLTRTKQSFVDLLTAQQQLALADASLALAEDTRKAAAERVRAGKVPPLEETKAAVEVANARIGQARARRDVQTARKRLAASWGETTPTFKEAAGEMDIVAAVPSLDALARGLNGVPEVARWGEEVILAEAALALARGARAPDIQVAVGISRFEEDGSHAGSAGLAVPLPLFDRNRGGIAAAQNQVTRAEYAQRAARLHAMADLAEAHNRLETARAEALAIRSDLLPGAEEAFAAARKGYDEGKLGCLDVLDAQRTIGEARARLLETLGTYHRTAADVERLTGVPLTTIP